jgi:hypothetical protein
VQQCGVAYNPYQPPTDLGVTSQPSTFGDANRAELSHDVEEALRQTKPWVMFLGVLGFLGAGFLVLGGLAVVAVGLPGVPGGRAVGLGYLLGALLYVFPSLFLVRYSTAIGGVLSGGGMRALGEAMTQQKRFWRFVGIAAVVMMALYFVIILVAFAIGVAGAM